MNEVLAISLRSMQADMARVEQISLNMSNVLTAGYKRGIAVQGPTGTDFAAHLTSAMGSRVDETGAAPVNFVVDSRTGTLKATGHALDLALVGKGYFEVITESGPAYTRNGSFRLDARGRLVTHQGHPVMGTSGEITLNLSNPVIGATGAISSASGTADATPLAQLKVVEFEDDAQLQRLGNGLYAAGSGMKSLADEEVRVRQAALENSNVSSAHEMTALVQTMRHFEAMQKVAQGYDDMLGTAIRKLGESS
jgi:flagellar basal-body rod protein FlgF